MIKGANEIYQSKWFAYEAMMFLQDPDDPRSTISNENVSFSIFTAVFINRYAWLKIPDWNINRSALLG